METVRFGVIGIGNMGNHHARSLSSGAIAGATLAAVADPRGERRDWARENLTGDVSIHDSGAEMIENADLDAVIIATPHYDHPPLAIAAFGKGLHVLCEKPAGVYTKAVREMNAAAGASGKVFGMMFQMRANPVYHKARELVAAGELGELRRVSMIVTDWYRTQSYYDSGGWRATWAGEGGGVLLNQCPHHLDLLCWIPGVLPERVRAFLAYGKFHDIEVEDDVTAYFEYANGATGTFVTTTGEAPGTCRIEISGDRGKMLLEGGRLTFYRTRVSVDEDCRTSKNGFNRPECWEIVVPAPSFAGKLGEHDYVLSNFVQGVLKGTPLLVPGEDGINGLSMSNAMHLSSWTDDWAALPVADDRFLELLNEKRQNSRRKDGAAKTLSLDGSFR